MAKKATRKATTKRKPRAAARKKAAAKKVARKKVVRKVVAAPPAVAELDGRIAVLRGNLRDLAEQAAASSGASNEELLSNRITEQEAKLQLLIKQRDELTRRGS
jgi:hypothetical protein